MLADAGSGSRPGAGRNAAAGRAQRGRRLHLFPVLALCVLYWQAEERERWLQLIERDRAELEAAVMQAFASARRPE